MKQGSILNTIHHRVKGKGRGLGIGYLAKVTTIKEQDLPELPEVETMRRGILGVVGGKITGVQRTTCKLKSINIRPRIDRFRRRAVGQHITEVDRLGKRVVLRLSNDNSIIFEPRMTGLVLVANPPNLEHLRLSLCLSGCHVKQLLYWDRRGLGSVKLLSPSELEDELGPNNLGPDALELSADQLWQRLESSRRTIKTALLDQRAIAGIGNLYASEILHQAGIHPEVLCTRLKRDQWQRIHTAMNAILQAAIQYEGSTLSDGTYRNALNESGGYQNHHRVYDREGATCPTCHQSEVVRIVQTQRSTFFCPTCQAKRPRASNKPR